MQGLFLRVYPCSEVAFHDQRGYSGLHFREAGCERFGHGSEVYREIRGEVLHDASLPDHAHQLRRATVQVQVHVQFREESVQPTHGFTVSCRQDLLSDLLELGLEAEEVLKRALLKDTPALGPITSCEGAKRAVGCHIVCGDDRVERVPHLWGNGCEELGGRVVLAVIEFCETGRCTEARLDVGIKCIHHWVSLGRVVRHLRKRTHVCRSLNGTQEDVRGVLVCRAVVSSSAEVPQSQRAVAAAVGHVCDA
mmetsp:Transcript_31509/g.91664  ORF Transcript_31509/g.91664 Transcript_31509/m.91664 type:complete len:251 (-) Transcript_31509:375-1127(-)